jgi:hypothetical protein
MTTQADGRAERDAALLMLHELSGGRRGRITTGADKAYDTRDFVNTVRELGVTPHVARRQYGAIDERTSRHPGYSVSLSKRWLVEKPFGWLKQIGPLRKVKLRGLAKVDWVFVFSCAAFNLIRIPKLRAQSAWSYRTNPLLLGHREQIGSSNHETQSDCAVRRTIRTWREGYFNKLLDDIAKDHVSHSDRHAEDSG